MATTRKDRDLIDDAKGVGGVEKKTEAPKYAFGAYQAPSYVQSQNTANLYNNWQNLASSGYNGTDKSNALYGQLQNSLAGKPADFASQYEGIRNDLYGQYANREPFKYDINADALYQQYKNQYMNLGKMAMNDAIGQASTMTGGYGNSYASTVGNQAYQSYLGQLNDKVPELYNLALSRYNSEGNELLNRYNMADQMYRDDYSKYQDAYDRWQNGVDDLRKDYQFEYNAGLTAHDIALDNAKALYNASNDNDQYKYSNDTSNSYRTYQSRKDIYDTQYAEEVSKLAQEADTSVEEVKSAYESFGFKNVGEMNDYLSEMYESKGKNYVANWIANQAQANGVSQDVAEAILASLFVTNTGTTANSNPDIEKNKATETAKKIGLQTPQELFFDDNGTVKELSEIEKPKSTFTTGTVTDTLLSNQIALDELKRRLGMTSLK